LALGIIAVKGIVVDFHQDVEAFYMRRGDRSTPAWMTDDFQIRIKRQNQKSACGKPVDKKDTEARTL